MVYSPIMPNMKLTAADMGVPDYANALRKGFQIAADVYKPSTAAAGLLDAMLRNKHNQIINEYLPRSEEARIGSTEANMGLVPYRQKLLEAQINKANRPPEPIYNNLEKAIQGYQRIQQQYGSDSPEAAQAQNYIQKLSGGMNAGSQLTNAIKTQQQNIIAGVPKIHKKIDDLIKAESPTNIIGFKPNQRAAHAALVKESAETYAKAKGWPNTNESIKAAMDILDRHTFESDEAYRKRLSRLKESLYSDLEEAKKTLNPGAVASSNSNNDPLGLGL